MLQKKQARGTRYAVSQLNYVKKRDISSMPGERYVIVVRRCLILGCFLVRAVFFFLSKCSVNSSALILTAFLFIPVFLGAALNSLRCFCFVFYVKLVISARSLLFLEMVWDLQLGTKKIEPQNRSPHRRPRLRNKREAPGPRS